MMLFSTRLPMQHGPPAFLLPWMHLAPGAGASAPPCRASRRRYAREVRPDMEGDTSSAPAQETPSRNKAFSQNRSAWGGTDDSAQWSFPTKPNPTPFEVMHLPRTAEPGEIKKQCAWRSTLLPAIGLTLVTVPQTTSSRCCTTRTRPTPTHQPTISTPSKKRTGCSRRPTRARSTCARASAGPRSAPTSRPRRRAGQTRRCGGRRGNAGGMPGRIRVPAAAAGSGAAARRATNACGGGTRRTSGAGWANRPRWARARGGT